MEPKSGADLVFTTCTGEVTHIAVELERLGELFGKKFSITPTSHRIAMATEVGKCCTESDVRATAHHMTHSVEVHRSTYQQSGNADETAQTYVLTQTKCQ